MGVCYHTFQKGNGVFIPFCFRLSPTPKQGYLLYMKNQKPPDTWWVSISGHLGVAEVFVLYIAVVVNTMSQVKYRFMLKKLT